MKSISIVVPVYNGAETIQTCLEAILHLDYPEGLFERSKYIKNKGFQGVCYFSSSSIKDEELSCIKKL